MNHPLLRLTAALILAASYYHGLFGPDDAVALGAPDQRVVRDIEESQVAFAEGRYADALLPTERVTRKVPQALYFNRLARIHRHLNHPREEAQAWEGVFRLSPTPEDACPDLAQAYDRIPDAEAALRAYERCLEVDPENPDSLLFVGRAYNGAGRKVEARNVLEKALKLAPNYADLYLLLGVRHYADGRIAQARPLFEKFLALAPQRREEVAVWLDRTKAVHR